MIRMRGQPRRCRGFTKILKGKEVKPVLQMLFEVLNILLAAAMATYIGWLMNKKETATMSKIVTAKQQR
jgi:flagellar basal body-associated protein FliL